MMKPVSFVVVGTLLTAGLALAAPFQIFSPNATGVAETVSLSGEGMDSTNPFFQTLGTNGRTCASCHQPAEGWSLTSQGVNTRFIQSGGTDPLFQHDGLNCSSGLTGSLAASTTLLRQRGLIRVELDVPPNAEFRVEKIGDPLGCGQPLNVPLQHISVHRRPLPATNLRFLSSVMWDGRESSSGTTIPEDLANQANHATLGHAQALLNITAEQAERIVAFQTQQYTAQMSDFLAGSLSDAGASGGASALVDQEFFIGINDPRFPGFDFQVFRVFNSNWVSAGGPASGVRESIRRGQALFNFRGCANCHNTPNVGGNSIERRTPPLRLSDPQEAAFLPVYKLTRLSSGQEILTTDPGRAMITGRWLDVNTFKVPILRGLATRAPYFHNGRCGDLLCVVRSYERNPQLNFRFTAAERDDLVAFLRAL